MNDKLVIIQILANEIKKIATELEGQEGLKACAEIELSNICIAAGAIDRSVDRFEPYYPDTCKIPHLFDDTFYEYINVDECFRSKIARRRDNFYGIELDGNLDKIRYKCVIGKLK